MGHMVANLNQGLGYTWMIQLEVADGWIHLTGEVVVMGSIPILDQIDNMVIIVIILIGGVRGDTFQMSSRKPSLLHSMER